MLHCGRDGELACYLPHFHLNQSCCRKKQQKDLGNRRHDVDLILWLHTPAATGEFADLRMKIFHVEKSVACLLSNGWRCSFVYQTGGDSRIPSSTRSEPHYSPPGTHTPLSAGTKACVWRKEVGAILLFLNLLIGAKVDVFSLSLTLHRICNCQPARLWLHSAAVAAAALAKRRWTVLIKIRMHKQLQQGWKGVFIWAPQCSFTRG